MFARRRCEVRNQRRVHPMMFVRLVEGQIQNGFSGPVERLGLRSGERVNLIPVRDRDPRRGRLGQSVEHFE